MAQWRIKEISDLTQVSVRMLHHYDKIGLLRPSVRASNGYRWYSEQDLAKLQQIVALRFFGFSLGQIKTILQQKLSVLEHLQVQQRMLSEQAEHLQKAKDALGSVLERCRASNSLESNDVITLIEGYHMKEELKKTWAGKLSEGQQEQYLALKKEFPKEFKASEDAIKLINGGTLGDPEGPDGEKMAKLFIDLTKRMHKGMGRERKLNAEVLKSVKEGKLNDLPLSPEGQVWLAKASLAYSLKRCNAIYKDIEKNLKADPKGAAGKKIAKAWQDFVNELFIGTPPALAIGIIVWQEVGRQLVELKEQKTTPSYEEQVKKIHVPLYFNPEAMSWIEKALGEEV